MNLGIRSPGGRSRSIATGDCAQGRPAGRDRERGGCRAEPAAQVLVRTHAVGLCGSDIGLYQGTYEGPKNYPIYFGHEWSGTVEAVGPDGDSAAARRQGHGRLLDLLRRVRVLRPRPQPVPAHREVRHHRRRGVAPVLPAGRAIRLSRRSGGRPGSGGPQRAAGGAAHAVAPGARGAAGAEARADAGARRRHHRPVLLLCAEIHRGLRARRAVRPGRSRAWPRRSSWARTRRRDVLARGQRGRAG